ncbi:hypothetical protein [Pseudomonas putida]|uniref:Uncharacterized protein n=1 Tax=Pseudomonas putida TaxID=303 RepID=A0A6S5U4H8_PSEPU|nr:hypothetical protein [Pseudomonas putida]BBT41449.1 hypothetical protein WP8W18C01_37900 [Pseudomonas putida]
MPTDKNNVEALMQACQRGVAGKGPAIEAANNLLAECYGALGKLTAENEALRKDAERYRFVRNPIGTSSPLAIWNEGKMPLFSGMADAVVDEFMAKEAQP